MTELTLVENVESFDITQNTKIFACNPTIAKDKLNNSEVFIVSKSIENPVDKKLYMLCYINNRFVLRATSEHVKEDEIDNDSRQ